jgi:transcriptional regulator with XRE-family HTH domain
MTTIRSARAFSIRARELGRHLRGAQELSGLNGKTLARRLGWSETRLSRVLSGRASSDDVDISALLALCGVTGGWRADILRLCHPSADPNVLRLPVDEHTDAYAAHSAEATAVFEYQPNSVPRIGQVPDYPRSVFGVHVTSHAGLRTLLDLPDVSLLVHEWALRNPVASAGVMSDQVHHLLRLSVRSNLSIRVIPLKSAAVPAAAGGFALVECADYDPFVYREEPTAGLLIGDADEVGRYAGLRRVLRAAAFDEAASRELLNAIAIEFGADADQVDAACACALPCASGTASTRNPSSIRGDIPEVAAVLTRP